MNRENDPELTGKSQTAYVLRREAVRRASISESENSPSALDATLARISAEVTEEAMERLSRSTKPK